jgi:hypothetical protein
LTCRARAVPFAVRKSTGAPLLTSMPRRRASAAGIAVTVAPVSTMNRTGRPFTVASAEK